MKVVEEVKVRDGRQLMVSISVKDSRMGGYIIFQIGVSKEGAPDWGAPEPSHFWDSNAYSDRAPSGPDPYMKMAVFCLYMDQAIRKPASYWIALMRAQNTAEQEAADRVAAAELAAEVLARGEQG